MLIGDGINDDLVTTPNHNIVAGIGGNLRKSCAPGTSAEHGHSCHAAHLLVSCS